MGEPERLESQINSLDTCTCDAGHFKRVEKVVECDCTVFHRCHGGSDASRGHKNMLVTHNGTNTTADAKETTSTCRNVLKHDTYLLELGDTTRSSPKGMQACRTCAWTHGDAVHAKWLETCRDVSIRLIDTGPPDSPTGSPRQHADLPNNSRATRA